MHLPSYVGSARTTFHHHPSTIPLPLKSPNDKPITLATLCKDSTPPCHLNPFLFNGHLQTIYTAVHSDAVPVNYKRRVFDSTDQHYPGTFAVDFAVHAEAPEKDATLHARTTYYTEEEWAKMPEPESTTPMIVALHGLSGGSHELYLRHVLSPMINGGVDGSQQKWEACVVNARGCAKSKITSSVLFNARATWDVRQIVKWLRETFPKRPLFATGFSLGANILVNYLAEEGENCEFIAAVVLSNPWNLDIGNTALQRTWIGREVYSKTMTDGLKVLFERNIDEMRKNPAFDVEKIMSSRYIHDFDREVQVPSWGYPSEGAYYRDASSIDSLFSVKIPVFAIHAEDDPVAPNEALPYIEVQQTPYVVLCTTTLGGHLSWFELGGGRWFVKPTENFLRKMYEEVDLDALKTQSRPNEHVYMVPDSIGRRFVPLRRKLIYASETPDPRSE